MKQNGMIYKIRKLNSLEQYRIEWDGWDGFPKHGVNTQVMIISIYSGSTNVRASDITCGPEPANWNMVRSYTTYNF